MPWHTQKWFGAWPYNVVWTWNIVLAKKKKKATFLLLQSELCLKTTETDPRFGSIHCVLKGSTCCLVNWSKSTHPLTNDLLKCSMVILQKVNYFQRMKWGLFFFFNSSKNENLHKKDCHETSLSEWIWAFWHWSIEGLYLRAVWDSFLLAEQRLASERQTRKDHQWNTLCQEIIHFRAVICFLVFVPHISALDFSETSLGLKSFFCDLFFER